MTFQGAGLFLRHYNEGLVIPVPPCIMSSFKKFQPVVDFSDAVSRRSTVAVVVRIHHDVGAAASCSDGGSKSQESRSKQTSTKEALSRNSREGGVDQLGGTQFQPRNATGEAASCKRATRPDWYCPTMMLKQMRCASKPI